MSGAPEAVVVGGGLASATLRVPCRSTFLSTSATGGSAAVKIFLLVTALSFASALLLSLTSFTRIVIVLSFLRQALGTPQLPPNPVLMGLSLFLTMFIMAPTVSRVHHDALAPYLDDKLTASEALERGETVKISSFGTFGVRQKGQRIGRNPKTGQEVPILPRRVLVFRASHVLKGRINGTNPPPDDDE